MLEDAKDFNKSLLKKIESRGRKIESREKELKRWEEVHNSVKAKIYTNFINSNDIIKLDVGGKLFNTSKQTLMSIENTYFYGLLANSNKFKTNEEGVFFVDRNPLVFDRVLDFFRTGKLVIKDLTSYMLDMLKDDMDYYCIPLPEELQPVPISSVPLLMWDENRKSTNCIYSNNNLTVTKTGDGIWDCLVIGNVAVDKFTVRIDKIKNWGGVLIGFTNGDIWNPNKDHSYKNGWYINVYDGKLYGIGIEIKNGINSAPYSSEIKNGDYLTVIREGNTIRFKRNKIDLGICHFEICPNFGYIPNQPLFPAVSMASLYTSVTIVNNYWE